MAAKQVERARNLLERAIKIDRTPVTAVSLAAVYEATKSYEKSEQLLLQSLQTLHPDDPAYAVALNNLARVYYRTGRYAESETLFKEAMPRFQRLFGGADTAKVLDNYADLQEALGQHEEADVLRTRARSMRNG